MKKFGKILICLILCVFAVGLAACKEKPDPFFQTNSTYAIGNGGLAVESDGYLYFVNGYKESGSQEKQNASYTIGSLKVAKLNNGKLTTNDNGSIKDDYLRTMSDKLCGFEATSLYVFGDYLYFTSPCQEKIKGGDWAKERVDFNRIKLNKTGSVERVYQSNVNWDSLTYKYYYDGSSVYLMVCEVADSNTKIYRINATQTKNNTEEVCGNVTKYAFANETSGKVFYITTQDNKNNYVLLNPITGNKTTMQESSIISDVVGITNNYVFFTTTASNNLNQLRYYTISGDNLGGGIQLGNDYNGTKSFIVSQDNYVLSVDDTSISLIGNPNFNLPSRNLVSAESSVKVLGFANGAVVYYNGTELKSAVLTTGEVNVIETVDGLDTEHNSIAGNYVYYFKTANNNKYLFRVSALGGNSELVGVYEEGDAPKVEDEVIY